MYTWQHNNAGLRVSSSYSSKRTKCCKLVRLAPTGQPSGQPLPVWLASGHCSSHSGPPTEQPFGASIFPWKREKSQNGCPRRRQSFLLQRANSLTPRPPVPTRFVPHQLCHSQIGCTVGDKCSMRAGNLQAQAKRSFGCWIWLATVGGSLSSSWMLSNVN